MTRAEPVVLDASVLVRAVVDPNSVGAHWVAAVDHGTVEGHTAALAFTEVAHALLRYVRAGALTFPDAVGALEALMRVPFRVHAQELAAAAMGSAFDLGLSAYDGTYAAIAESLGATLVTADRRLARAVTRSELVV